MVKDTIRRESDTGRYRDTPRRSRGLIYTEKPFVLDPTPRGGSIAAEIHGRNLGRMFGAPGDPSDREINPGNFLGNAKYVAPEWWDREEIQREKEEKIKEEQERRKDIKKEATVKEPPEPDEPKGGSKKPKGRGRGFGGGRSGGGGAGRDIGSGGGNSGDGTECHPPLPPNDDKYIYYRLPVISKNPDGSLRECSRILRISKPPKLPNRNEMQYGTRWFVQWGEVASVSNYYYYLDSYSTLGLGGWLYWCSFKDIFKSFQYTYGIGNTHFTRSIYTYYSRGGYIHKLGMVIERTFNGELVERRVYDAKDGDLYYLTNCPTVLTRGTPPIEMISEYTRNSWGTPCSGGFSDAHWGRTVIYENLSYPERGGIEAFLSNMPRVDTLTWRQTCEGETRDVHIIKEVIAPVIICDITPFGSNTGYCWFAEEPTWVDTDDDDTRHNIREVTLPDMNDEKCCGMIRRIYEFLDPESFPAQMPSKITVNSDNPNNQTKEIRTLPEWLMYRFDIDDERWGEFEIKVEIDDVNPLTKEKEKETIKLPNLAESIAELFGIVMEIAISHQVTQNAVLTCLHEAGLAHAAAFKAGREVSEILDYIGFETEEKYETLKTAFTPEAESFEELLEPNESKVKIVNQKNAKETLQTALNQIKEIYSIVRAQGTLQVDGNNPEKDILMDLIRLYDAIRKQDDIREQETNKVKELLKKDYPDIRIETSLIDGDNTLRGAL